MFIFCFCEFLLMRFSFSLFFVVGILGPGVIFPTLFFIADSKRCKGVYCVDLGESFHMVPVSHDYLLFSSIYLQIWLRYSRERAL